jgi:hypothetical protein
MSWEVYLAAAPADFTYTGKLYEALRRHARVFWEERDLLPGEARDTACAKALSAAWVSLFVLSRTSGECQPLGASIAAATRRIRSDSPLQVVPVLLDEAVVAAPPYGTANLNPVRDLTDDHEEVAKDILRVVSSLRAQRKVSPTVAIVAVADELSVAQQAVVQRLRKLPMVREASFFDAARPESFDEASVRDFRLILVGMRTGGTEVLKRLAEGGAARTRVLAPDPNKFNFDEIQAAKALWDTVSKSFASPEEAAANAQELFNDWLKDWAPQGEGRGAVPEVWETKYLQTVLGRWARGSYGGLQARAGRRQLDRARLYVSLRARKESAFYADENERLVVLREDPDSSSGCSAKRSRNDRHGPNRSSEAGAVLHELAADRSIHDQCRALQRPDLRPARIGLRNRSTARMTSSSEVQSIECISTSRA